MNTNGLLDGLRRLDAERPPIPGGHWLALGTGMVLLLGGGRGSVLGRALALAAGGALVYRAYNGPGGLKELLQRESQAPARRVVMVDGAVVASSAEPEPLASAEVVRDRLSLEEEEAAEAGRS
jgi:hypothetical protein